MTRKTYFPDPDDSAIAFNMPPDTSIDDGSTEEQQNFQLALRESSEDSDEAPEDVPFSASKQVATTVRKAEELGRKAIREKKKEKRIKVEALLKVQKEEKAQRLASLAAKRLPEDLLDTITSAPIPKKAKEKSSKKKTAVKKKLHIKFDSEHYIPLSTEGVPTQFQVAVLESKSWKNKLSKPGQCPVQDFRQKALYNAKIKREPTSSIQQAKLKLQISGKDTLVKSSYI